MNTHPTPTSTPAQTQTSASMPSSALHKPNHEQPPTAGPNLKSPSFPTHLLPPSLRALTHSLSRNLRLPTAQVATLGLALGSAAIGPGATLAHGDRLTRPNLFFLTLAENTAASDAAYRLAAAPLLDDQIAHTKEMETHINPELRAELHRLRAQRRLYITETVRDGFNRHNDLNNLEKQITRLQDQLRRDDLHLATHIPRGKLLPQLLAQNCYGLALINPDARHAAAVFNATPNSAAAQDETALLAGHRATPYISDRLLHQSHVTETPCLTLHWTLRPTDWHHLTQNPNFQHSPLLPRFLILNTAATPNNVAASGSLRSDLLSSPTIPDSAAATPAHSCLTPTGSHKPAQGNALGLDHTRASADGAGFLGGQTGPEPTSLNVQRSTLGVGCSTDPAPWHQTLRNLLEWKLLQESTPYTLTPAAATLLANYEHECLTSPCACGHCHNPHLPDQAYRLTLLLHLTDLASPKLPEDLYPELPEELDSTVILREPKRPKNPVEFHDDSEPHYPSSPAPESSAALDPLDDSYFQDHPYSSLDAPSNQQSTIPNQQSAEPWRHISAQTAARALTLLRWFTTQQHPLLESLAETPDPDLQKITQLLTRAGGQMTLNLLRKNHSFTPRRIDSLLESYPDLLRLDDDPKPGPGRKSQFLTLISSTSPAPQENTSPENPSRKSPESPESPNSPEPPKSGTALQAVAETAPRQDPTLENTPSPKSPKSPNSPQAQVGAAFLPPTTAPCPNPAPEAKPTLVHPVHEPPLESPSPKSPNHPTDP